MPPAPQVSVVVRSYNRIPALLELLGILLRQRHDAFEVVVVDQSTKVAPADATRLAELERDPRLRVLRHPPLGGARARNVGVAAARGAIVLLVDDDDLPVGEDWIAAHVANYDDPRCLGVSGRQRFHEGETNPYLFKRLAYRRCMRFSPLLKLPSTYVRHTERKVPIDYIHGTNGSLRREAFDRFGGWDEDTRIEDETSFGMKARRLMRPGEYFCFDPRPVVQRRRDVPGGLDKRFMTAGEYTGRVLDFIHRIVGRYHRRRVIALYPLYLAAAYAWTVEWIWGDSQGYATTGRRVLGTLALLPAMPLHAARALRRLASGGPTGSGTGSPARTPAP